MQELSQVLAVVHVNQTSKHHHLCHKQSIVHRLRNARNLKFIYIKGGEEGTFAYHTEQHNSPYYVPQKNPHST